MEDEIEDCGVNDGEKGSVASSSEPFLGSDGVCAIDAAGEVTTDGSLKSHGTPCLRQFPHEG